MGTDALGARGLALAMVLPPTVVMLLLRGPLRDSPGKEVFLAPPIPAMRAPLISVGMLEGALVPT